MNAEEKKKLLDECAGKAIVVIIRGVAEEKLPPLLDALCEGGIRWAEITFDQKNPDTNEKTAQNIAMLKQRFAGKMHIGAGTVMTLKQAKLAIAAGAEFLISPNTNPKIIRYTASKNVISMPGAYTPTEIAAAYEAGADVVKVFPADALGVSYFKAVMAPLSHIPMMAVGGVNEKNVGDFLKLGLFGVGVGSALTPKQKIAEGDFAAITEMAKKFTQAQG